MRTNEGTVQKIENNNNKNNCFWKLSLFFGTENEKWEDEKLETFSS